MKDFINKHPYITSLLISGSISSICNTIVKVASILKGNPTILLYSEEKIPVTNIKENGNKNNIMLLKNDIQSTEKIDQNNQGE